MDKNIIKKHLSNLVNEAKGGTKTPGITVTANINKESGNINTKAIKDIDKKLSTYDKEMKKGAETTKVPNKFNYEGNSEKEYHYQMEIMNGQEMIQYDREPSKSFKDRAKEAIEGSTRMGNKGGEGIFNTEPAWGASSGDDYSKNLTKNIKKSTEKRLDAEKGIMSFGNDIEVIEKGVKPMSKFSAFNEDKTNNKPKIKERMKRLKFKKEFKGVGNALKMIPETYRVNNKEFEMTDGNESYKIRWEGTLTEGRAVILTASDKTLVKEDIGHMKHLMGYKSEKTLGLVKGKTRLDENKIFNDIYSKSRILIEGEDIEEEEEEKKPNTIKEQKPKAIKEMATEIYEEDEEEEEEEEEDPMSEATETTEEAYMNEGIQIGEDFFSPMEEVTEGYDDGDEDADIGIHYYNTLVGDNADVEDMFYSHCDNVTEVIALILRTLPRDYSISSINVLASVMAKVIDNFKTGNRIYNEESEEDQMSEATETTEEAYMNEGIQIGGDGTINAKDFKKLRKNNW